MSDQETKQGTPSRSEKIHSFLSRNRTTVTVVSVVVIVGIIGAVGLSQWLNFRAQQSAEMAKEIQELWEQWQGAQEGQEDAAPEALESELRDLIAEGQDEFSRGHAGTRAYFILGQLEWELGNFSAALEAYRETADKASGTYMEPLALSNAAAAAEELDDPESATELYGRLVGIENAPNLEKAHGLFSLGRIAESAEDYELALDYYNRLIDEHSDSNWTNLGRNRIIWLTSQGVGSVN